MRCDNCPMFVVRNVPLQPLNSFGIAARATALVRVRGEADVRAVLADAELAAQPRFVLGGGSNIVLTGDLRAVVLKVEVMGRRVLEATDRHTIVEAGAGENWHDFVTWTLEQGLGGLENLALIDPQRPPPADTALALREAPRADTHRYDRLRGAQTREGGYVH